MSRNHFDKTDTHYRLAIRMDEFLLWLLKPRGTRVMEHAFLLAAISHLMHGEMYFFCDLSVASIDDYALAGENPYSLLYFT